MQKPTTKEDRRERPVTKESDSTTTTRTVEREPVQTPTPTKEGDE